MVPYDTQDAEDFMEKLMALGNTEPFTRDQLLSLSQILHASNCVLNDEGPMASTQHCLYSWTTPAI